MGKETVTQVQEACRIPYRINPGRNMLKHTVIKLTKIKDRENMKINKGKATNNIQGNVHKIISRFFRRNSAGQKGVWPYNINDIFKVIIGKNLQPRLPSKALYCG